MTFSIAKVGEVSVVEVEGQLIVGNRQELKQKVLDELDRGERKFLIDFKQTGYIDSSGLGVLVSLSKKIRELGGELRLANLNDDLKTLFELTKLDTLFQISDTRDSALEWMEDRILEAAGWTAAEDEQPLALGEIEFFSELDAATLAEVAGAVREISL